MKSLRTLFAISTLALACGAQAADYNSLLDLGVFDDDTSSIGHTFSSLKPADKNAQGKLITAHSFESVIRFELSLVNDANGSVTLSNNRNFNLSIGNVSLMKQGQPGSIIDEDPNAGAFSFTGLSTGLYSLHVTGMLSAGFKGGSWGGNLNTQSVPEPSTWALMLMGLAGMGSLLRRRQVAAI